MEPFINVVLPIVISSELVEDVDVCLQEEVIFEDIGGLLGVYVKSIEDCWMRQRLWLLFHVSNRIQGGIEGGPVWMYNI